MLSASMFKEPQGGQYGCSRVSEVKCKEEASSPAFILGEMRKQWRVCSRGVIWSNLKITVASGLQIENGSNGRNLEKHLRGYLAVEVVLILNIFRRQHPIIFWWIERNKVKDDSLFWVWITGRMELSFTKMEEWNQIGFRVDIKNAVLDILNLRRLLKILRDAS